MYIHQKNINERKIWSYLLISHIQLCISWVSQKGIHLPPLHFPLSWQSVLSAMGGLLGHSEECPVHLDSSSQVAYCASRHFTPLRIYWQFWQHGEFLSLEKLNFIRWHISSKKEEQLPAHCLKPKLAIFIATCIIILCS